MTWLLQAAVVLAVILALPGAIWAMAFAYRQAKAHRRASAIAATELYTESQVDRSWFQGWLADLIDGDASHDGPSGSEHASGAVGDALDATSD
ncbi:hypothetical protein P2318_08010 [Myxococcaceae bacterium GXIMD 01537]